MPDFASESMRDFSDFDTTRKAIFDNTLSGLSSAFPIENSKFKLSLDDLSYESPKPFGLREQKQAILGNKDLTWRLRGTWRLYDKATGKLVSEKSGTVANVPYMTGRGTFIRSGNEYTITNQSRLKPGVYARKAASGELIAQVNTAPRTGPNFGVLMDPETGKFRLTMGQARIPLYPILKSMGVTDNELRDKWGQELFVVNRQDDPAAVKKVAAFFRLPTDDGIGVGEKIRETFGRMRLDPNVAFRNLGMRQEHVDPALILQASSKLLRINRNEEDEDDRDALNNQTIHSVDDFVKERFEKDYAGIARQLLNKVTFRNGNLESMPHSPLSSYFDALFNQSGLAMSLEEINPLEIFDQNHRVVRLGEGGIASKDAVPDAARQVQTTYAGFIDPVRGPESANLGVDSRFAWDTYRGPNNTLLTRVMSLDGQQKFLTGEDFVDHVVAFPGEMESDRRKVRAFQNGKLQYVDRSKVNYTLPNPQSMFSLVANLVPMMSGVHGNRLLMGSKMQLQALPLQERESPYVQSQAPDGQSFHRMVGKNLGAIFADTDGIVLNVTPEQITIRGADGKNREIELYHNHPYNRKTFVHNEPVVTPGTQIRKGQLLAHSNFTDKDGTYALGRNLSVAYMPFRVPEGLNYEDAVVISESAAKKLSSMHMYQHGLDEGRRSSTKGEFVSLYPSKFDARQTGQISDSGVVKVGAVVKHGDPLILSLEDADPEVMKNLHRSAKFTPANKSVLWQHESPGVVTDVVESRSGPAVVVKSFEQMQVGDKLAGRYGDKGVVAAIVPDEKMIRGKDGNVFDIVVNPLGVISRANPSQVVEAALGKIAAKTGQPYVVSPFYKGDRIRYAMEELKRHGLSDTEDLFDPEAGRPIKGVFTGNRYYMKLSHTAASKSSGRGSVGEEDTYYTVDRLPAHGGGRGCFAPKQSIVTIEGDMDIAKICEKRLGINVRTFDESTKEWVYRPVTDWFTYRANVSDLICVQTSGGPSEKGTGVNRVVTNLFCTKNHIVCLFDGSRIEAGKLKIGDQLTTWGPVPTADQWAFLYGTMLGDAYANENEIKMEHSLKQVDYVNWKQRVLSGLNPKVRDQHHKNGSNSGFGVHSRAVSVNSDWLTNEITTACYTGVNGKKAVTEFWLSHLNGLSVAAWVLDDGWIGNRSKKKGQVHLQGNIATHGFERAGTERLAQWLSDRYKQTCTVNTVGAISLSVGMCKALVEEIAAWVPAKAIPGSKKWLKRRVAEIQETNPPRQIDSVCRLSRVPLRVTDIYPYEHDKPDVTEINVYDFTVADTHTYVAGRALVSNSKRFGVSDMNALVAHGAWNVIRDAHLIRGQRNDDYWRALRLGQVLPTPKGGFVYDKFFAKLKGAGINVEKKGNRLNFMALRDSDTDQLSAGALPNAGKAPVDANTMRPSTGGLFDPQLTGGHEGTKWTHINLSEPMPNPVMEDPIRHLLGLTRQGMRDVIAGKKVLNGHTGPAAIYRELNRYNVDAGIRQAEEDIRSGKVTRRDPAIRRLGYLTMMKKTGISPVDMMWTKVPVMPPVFRPIVKMGQTALTSDVNELYRDVANTNSVLTQLRKAVGERGIGDERLALYDSIKAVVGLGDPVGKISQTKQLKGLLSQVFGSSPKFGVYQRQLIGRPQDVVGRAVISPDPSLDMDEVGIPEAKAWDMYAPFVINRLVRSGFAPLDAALEVRKKTKRAKEALEDEVTHRPVIINRAPTLHRFSLQAAWPKLTKNETMTIPPLLTAGFGADFDGDAMQFHVPVSDEARRDAIQKMMPSRNLLSSLNFGVHFLPSQEFQMGLFTASSKRREGSPPRVFRSAKDVVHAFRRGQISADDVVKIVGES